MPINIDVSEFQPVRVPFEIYDDNGMSITGDEDLWIVLIPPTFREDKLRGELSRVTYSSNGTATPVTNPRMREAEEIWLTFGGTNLSVVLPKLDETGSVMWKKLDNGEMEVVKEEVAFPENGKQGITRQDFMARLDRLPDYIVTSWHNLVIRTVAKGWAFPF